MKVVLLLFCLAVTQASASPKKIAFWLPESCSISACLVLPEDASMVSHQRTEQGDSICAIPPGKGEVGFVVEISDPRGKMLWSHDFGSNSSASEGNKIELVCHPKLPLMLVHYSGYKWDHDHKLLFIGNGKAPSVREYSGAEGDILPYLRRQKDFPSDFRYLIYPLRFIEHGVEFECIPLQKPERQSAHLFAQDEQWYHVTTTISSNQKITPSAVTTTH